MCVYMHMCVYTCRWARCWASYAYVCVYMQVGALLGELLELHASDERLRRDEEALRRSRRDALRRRTALAEAVEAALDRWLQIYMCNIYVCVCACICVCVYTHKCMHPTHSAGSRPSRPRSRCIHPHACIIHTQLAQDRRGGGRDVYTHMHVSYTLSWLKTVEAEVETAGRALRAGEALLNHKPAPPRCLGGGAEALARREAEKHT